MPAAEAEAVEDALRHGAVRLFVARAPAGGAHLLLDPQAAAAVANLCRRLDGIPLAIELAAARVGELGVDGVASRLDGRFRLLMRGRRIALTRHQTLRATLDWSYGLLSEPERAVMRRLAVFAGDFSPHAADRRRGGRRFRPAGGYRSAWRTSSRSLWSPRTSAVRAPTIGCTTRYGRTRWRKCTESGEFGPVARRHAEYYRDVFERVEAEWDTRPPGEWLADYSRQIDNVRAALDWAFSPTGDASIGVGLTAASEPLWMHLSLLDECHGRVDRALANVPAGSGGNREREMQLLAARAAALMHASPFQQTGGVWTEVLELARTVNDTEYQLRALWGLFACHIVTGEFSSGTETRETILRPCRGHVRSGDR